MAQSLLDARAGGCSRTPLQSSLVLLGCSCSTRRRCKRYAGQQRQPRGGKHWIPAAGTPDLSSTSPSCRPPLLYSMPSCFLLPCGPLGWLLLPSSAFNSSDAALGHLLRLKVNRLFPSISPIGGFVTGLLDVKIAENLHACLQVPLQGLHYANHLSGMSDIC